MEVGCDVRKLMLALLRLNDLGMCSLSTEQSKTLFVRGLSEDTTEETLRESFEGSISARIVTDRDTGSSKGYVKHHLGLVPLLQRASLEWIYAMWGLSCLCGWVFEGSDLHRTSLERCVCLQSTACAHFSMSSFLPTNLWQPMDSHEKNINCSALAHSQWGSIGCDEPLLFYK